MPFDLINIPKRDLERYSDPEKLNKEAVAYVGQLRRHQEEAEKIYLRLDPLRQSSALLEFNKSDILYVEDVKTISQEGGDAFRLAKIWVRRGAVAIRLEPFIVQDLSHVFSEY